MGLLATLLAIHKAWAWVVIIGNGLAGVWILTARKVPSLRTRAMWWFAIVCEVAVFVQVILGVAAMNTTGIEPAKFHMFYGFIAIVAIAILYSYREQMKKHLYLLYGLGSLFIMGLGIRALLKV